MDVATAWVEYIVHAPLATLLGTYAHTTLVTGVLLLACVAVLAGIFVYFVRETWKLSVVLLRFLVLALVGANVLARCIELLELTVPAWHAKERIQATMATWVQPEHLQWRWF